MIDHWEVCDPAPIVGDVEKVAAQIFGKCGTSADAQLVAGYLAVLQCQLIAVGEEIADLKNLLATALECERES